MAEKRTILKVLVGSHAHGLANATSDRDYRGVYMVKTSEILRLRPDVKPVSWVEGDIDDTSYELSHFLNLATRSNPSVLEVFVSPLEESTPEGISLRELFPFIWSSNDVLNAFRGYSRNQRKKFLEDKDERPWKFACAQIRVLLLGIELLRYGTMTVDVKVQQFSKLFDEDLRGRPDECISETLMGMKEGYFRDKGFVIDWAGELEKALVKAYEANPHKVTDTAKVEEWLLKVRKENW